jgi:hypothetical protein
MQKKMKNVSIGDKPGCTSLNFDVLNEKNVKNNKTKVTLKKNGQESKDYFLYHSISKY